MIEYMQNNSIRTDGITVESEIESELNELLIDTGIMVSNNCSYGCDFTFSKQDKFILAESKSCKPRVKNGWQETRFGLVQRTKPGFFEIRETDFEKETMFFIFTIRNNQKKRYFVSKNNLQAFINKKKCWKNERIFLTQLEMFKLPKIKDLKKYITRFF